MTKKKRGRGKKYKSPKQLQQPPLDDEQSPTFQTSEVESDEEQSDERNGSTTQNTPISVAGKDCERTEYAHSKGQISDCSGDVTASLGSVQRGIDKGQQQLEVGLSQIASYSKNNSVLSSLAPVFEANIANIRNQNTREAPLRVDLTRNNLSREVREENGAG